MNFVRLGINLFIALMISVVGGVTYQPIVEKPISYYYNQEVTHTSHDYSYKPGQSGTEFFFFIKEGNDYRSLNILETFGIPTLFYLFFISLFGIIFRLIIYGIVKRPPQKNAGPVTVFLKRGGEKKSKQFILPVLVTLFSGLFVFGGHNSWWRDNNSGGVVQNFTTDQIIFVPNQDEGNIWVIDIDKVDPASALRQIEPEKADEMGYFIKTINPNSKEVTDVDSLTLPTDYYSFQHYYSKGKLWLMARPDFMRVYNTSDMSTLYGSVEDFTNAYPILGAGIEKYYPIFDEANRLHISTLDGGRYYYNFDLNEVNADIQHLDKKRPYFSLKVENGKRFILEFGENKKVEDHFFTNGLIVFQNEAVCVIQHFSDVTDQATFTLSSFSNEGELLWEKDQAELPYNKSNDLLSNVLNEPVQIDCSQLGNHIVMVFNEGENSSGLCCISSKSGKIEWSYTQRDLNDVINQRKDE